MEEIYVEAEAQGTGEIIRGKLVFLEGTGGEIAPLPCVFQAGGETGNTFWVIRRVIRVIREEDLDG